MAVSAVLTVLAGVHCTVQASDLDDAVRSGDVDAVRALLDTPAISELNSFARDGLAPLLRAVQADDAAVTQLLLEAGADPNVENRFGVSALWLAATNRSAPMTQLLLEAGADATAAMPHGETPLMAAARAGAVQTIALLLSEGADPNASEETHGETALMWAAAEDHAEVVRVLVDGGADPDQASQVLELAPMNWVQVGMVSTVLPVGGWTAMMYAARENAADAALALLRAGADADARDPDGNTALLIALANDHFDLAAALLAAGVDPNVADNSGMGALYAAVERATSGVDFGRPPVPRFDEYDALDLVRLALEHGADVNAQLLGPTLARHHGFPDRALSAGSTALMRAARARHVELVELLLAAGADATLTQNNGSSVLHLLAASGAPRDEASLSEQAHVLDTLLSAGADVAAVSDNGETPLHRAARSANGPLIEALFAAGTDIEATTTDGETALDIVRSPGRFQNDAIAALLERLAEG